MGAVFQAAVVRRATLAGVDGATVWHFKGNAYGLIDADDNTRLTMPLYQWGPQHLVGRAAAVSCDQPELEAIAITSEAGKKSVLLINKANRTMRVADADKLVGPDAAMARVSADVIAPLIKTTVGPTLDLPGYSLTLLAQ